MWEKFHVRLTLLYGTVILVALAVLSTAFYVGGVNIAMSGIRARLVVILLRGVPDCSFPSLSHDRAVASTASRAVLGRLRSI